MIMIHPNLINAWSVAGMDASEIPVWHILFFDIRQVGYQGHVIPVIIAVWLMCQIEKWLHKHVPEMIDLFVTPLVTVLVTGFLTLAILGPIFSTAENYILDFAQWIITVGHGIGSMIMGALYPLTVVCGIHHMYNVIEAGMLSAALGITEPAIFGVNLRFVKPLICGMAGGAAGALLGSIFHIGATSYGVTGIPGFLITLDYTVQYAIVLAVSFAIAFILTWIVWKEEEPEKETVEKQRNITEEKTQELPKSVKVQEEPAVYAPVKGKVIPREEIPDETFASGVLGDGVGIEPAAGEVRAPYDGEISSVTDTRHAIGIIGPKGMELLIHVGIDTVNMKGDGFELLVAEGDKVKKGQKLLTFDMDKIKKAGYSTTTAVLVTNSDDYEACQVEKTGDCDFLEKIITVK